MMNAEKTNSYRASRKSFGHFSRPFHGLGREAWSKIIRIAVLMILTGVLFWHFQTRVEYRYLLAQYQYILEKKEQMLEVSSGQRKLVVDINTAIFDRVYGNIMTAEAVFLEMMGLEYQKAKLAELSALTRTDILTLLDSDLQVVSSSQEQGLPDFTGKEYELLLKNWEDTSSVTVLEIYYHGEKWRCYGHRCGDSMLVGLKSGESLEGLKSINGNLADAVSSMSMPNRGKVILCNLDNNTIEWHPDADCIGRDMRILGPFIDEIPTEGYSSVKLADGEYYCRSCLINEDGRNCLVLFLIQKNHLILSDLTALVMNIIIFINALLLIFLYMLFVGADDRRPDPEGIGNNLARGNENWKHRLGPFCFHDRILKVTLTYSLINVLVIFGVGMYVLSLDLIADVANSNLDTTESLKDREAVLNEMEDAVNTAYQTGIELNTRLSGFIVDELIQHDLLTQLHLENLCSILELSSVTAFGKDGQELLSSGSIEGMSLYVEPFKEFSVLLKGRDYMVGKKLEEDPLKGSDNQYSGVAIVNNGSHTGAVVVSSEPNTLQEARTATYDWTVLDRMETDYGGFTLGVDKETLKIIADSSPGRSLSGKSALQVLNTAEERIRGGLEDFLFTSEGLCYVNSFESDSLYIFVITPVGRIIERALPVALIWTVGALLLLLIVLFCAAGSTEKGIEARIADEKNKWLYERAAGTESEFGLTGIYKKKNNALDFEDKDADEKIAMVIKLLIWVDILSLILLLAFSAMVSNEYTVIRYVLQGKWVRNFNIFSITACLIAILIGSITITVIIGILKLIARASSPRGATILTMIASVAKYAGVLIIIYYCLSFVGVQTMTLLASAGILTATIGLGANSLMTDIFAGLFIIFEGSFTVGDMVLVGDWRGTVIDIGIRTTRIMDPGRNIKIINNGDIRGIVNLTVNYSRIDLTMEIEYEADLKKVEESIKSEFPRIKRRFPEIVEGPYYMGVEGFTANGVLIYLRAYVAEQDKDDMIFLLKREYYLIFNKHGISIPYQHIQMVEPAPGEEQTEKKIIPEESKEEKKESGDL